MNTEEMLARTRRYALDVIALSDLLPNKPSGWVLGKQVLRSGTSVGANYHEAQRSQTRNEFNSKIHLCQQELAETAYWLSLIEDASLVRTEQLVALRRETDELQAIFMAISKKSSQPPPSS